MSSNFLQFNPTQANMENDAAYVTDPTRTGGSGVGALWPSNSANKTLYQLSTFITAFAQMMANKGFVMSDANVAALTAVLTNVLTTADGIGALQSVSWAANIALNAGSYSGFQIALAGNTTLTISGQTPGRLLLMLFAQDSAGGHTVVFPSGAVGGAQPDPTPSVISAQLFSVDSSLALRAVGPSISALGMGGLAIGSVNAQPGNFTTLKLNGSAPAGLVLAGDGASYVPMAAPGWTAGSNINGSWQVDPTGLIRQRGLSAGIPTGGNREQIAVTFPIPFTSPPIVVVSPNNFPAGFTGDSMCCYPVNITTTGFIVCYTAAVNIGGSGAPGLNNAVQTNWMAEGT